MNIENYLFGRIVIDGKSYSSDLIIFPNRIVSPWWRRKGHELHSEDINHVLEFGPDEFIVGTGFYGQLQVLPATQQTLKKAQIKLHIMKTSDACQLFNKLIQSTPRLVAALHLTC